MIWNRSADPTLHGSARWARAKDLEKSGLFGEEGVYVGGWKKRGKIRYLRDGSDRHVMVVAPPGSGKTVSAVVPTMLSWPESVVVLDIKGEIWDLTAGWRSAHAGSKVLRFDPAAETGSCRFNPVAEIRKGTLYEVADAQNLATLIVDPDGKGIDNHWDGWAQTMFAGCLLYLSYTEPEHATMAGLDQLLTNPRRSLGDLWKAMLTFDHPVVAQAGRDMIDKGGGQEARDVISTTKRFLSLYRDPVVARNTSRSDFCIDDLMRHAAPVSLYLIIPVPDKDRLRSLTRTICNLVMRKLCTGSTVDRSDRHRLLFLLDEFPSLGRLGIMEQTIAEARGFGIRLMLVAQDRKQLKAAYGPNETITGCCGVQVAFPPAPGDEETAEHWSKLTGISTRWTETRSWSGMRLTRGKHATQRYLMTPDEVRQMPGPQKQGDRIVGPGELLVFVQGMHAVRATQSCYFFDETFKARAAVPAPKFSDRL